MLLPRLVPCGILGAAGKVRNRGETPELQHNLEKDQGRVNSLE